MGATARHAVLTWTIVGIWLSLFGCSPDYRVQDGFYDPTLGTVSALPGGQQPVADPAPAVGSPCSSNAACGANRVCLDPAQFPGGYCSISGCEQRGCADGSQCYKFASDSSSYCFATCRASSDCRAGYSCDQFGSCYPDPTLSRTGGTPGVTSFSAAVNPVLVRLCVGCHVNCQGTLCLSGVASEDFNAVSGLVDLNTPASSPLLLIPTNQSYHGGGKVISVDSSDYQTILSWIEQGAKNN